MTGEQRIRERAIARHLVSLGYDLQNSRVHADGRVEVFLGPAATDEQRAAAQAAADAWRPAPADLIAAAAERRGIAVVQLAAARAAAALAAGQTPPAWARTVLSAEAARIDEELS